MKMVEGADDSLLVDISDALSERDRVRFTVHTRSKLPQFNKPVMSVVRQHEEFIWLHDCLEENDLYAGYIIPPAPPKPDFDASREKLQRLGDGEANMSKEEFAKMKQELEAEYLAIFKKTVAMHEIFLQRLAAHEKFREDNNFKIFLEYENELAVRCKSAKEKLAGSIQNIGKSLTDFVITTSQVAATNSASTSLLTGVTSSPTRHRQRNQQQQQQRHLQQQPKQDSPTRSSDNVESRQQSNGNISINSNIDTKPTSDIRTTIGIDSRGAASASSSSDIQDVSTSGAEQIDTGATNAIENKGDGQQVTESEEERNNNNLSTASVSTGGLLDVNVDDDDNVDEQYFEKERLRLALYCNGIRETASQADKVTQAQRSVADNYLQISQQFIKLASIEVVPITAQTKDSSSFVACPLPSLTLPDSLVVNQGSALLPAGTSSDTDSGSTFNGLSTMGSADDVENRDKPLTGEASTSGSTTSKLASNTTNKKPGGCADHHTSEGLKQLLLHVSDYFEQARKIETRIASDEDLKLTDTFLYYKRDTIAAQELLMRRLRFMAEYETATRNMEKARQKGRTQMQYADVIQKKARENFVSISKLAKQEIADYKQRRVAAIKKAFSELVELELKHLRSHSQLIMNCLNTCRGQTPVQPIQSATSSKSAGPVAFSSASSTARAKQ